LGISLQGTGALCFSPHADGSLSVARHVGQNGFEIHLSHFKKMARAYSQEHCHPLTSNIYQDRMPFQIKKVALKLFPANPFLTTSTKR
jgi:hypothetical protein